MRNSTTRSRPRRRPTLALAALATLLAFSAARARQSTGPQTPTQSLDFVSGLCVHGNIDQAPQSEYDAMRDAGVTMLRVDMDWNGIEPYPVDATHPYVWTRCQAIYDKAALANMKVLFTVAYGNKNYSPHSNDDKFAPDDATAVAACAAMCNKAAIKFPTAMFEIWNEQDTNGFWKPAANPQGYVDLLSACAQAIKAGRPGAHVMMGGVAHCGTLKGADVPSFLGDVCDLAYAQGVMPYVDSIGFHPYVNGDQGATRALAANVRAVLDAHHAAGKPMYATEIGQYAEGWIAPAMDQATWTAGSPNLVPDSADPAAASWAPYYNKPTMATVTGPSQLGSGPGTPLAYEMTHVANVDGRNGLIARNAAMTAGSYYTSSVWLKSSTSQSRALLVGQSDGTTKPVWVGPTWKRFAWTTKYVPDAYLTDRAFQIYAYAGGPKWQMAAPTTILSASQSDSAYLSAERALFASMATDGVRAMYDAGAAGSFYFCWRDVPSCPAGFEFANGSMKTECATNYVGCLTAPGGQPLARVPAKSGAKAAAGTDGSRIR